MTKLRITLVITAFLALTCCAEARKEAVAKGNVDNEYDCIEGNYATVAFLGDSNIWLAGDSLNGKRSWATWVTQALHPCTVRNYARSGATICNTVNTIAAPEHYSELLNDTNTLYNQAYRLRMDVKSGKLPVPDLIIVGGGTNDGWFSSRRPGLFDTESEAALSKITSATPPAEATTLQRSLRLINEVLREAAPDAEIVYVGPPLTLKTSEDVIHKVNEYVDMAGKAVDLSESGVIDLKQEGRKFDKTYDGVHTSERGARGLAEYVLDWLIEN